MKFHVCGGLDAPDWILANIVTLSTLVSAASPPFFFPLLSFYFANAQCMYVRMHACMRFFLFGFVNDLSGTLKKKKIRFLLLSVVLAASLKSLYNLQI
jgi:hypothetical protein